MDKNNLQTDEHPFAYHQKGFINAAIKATRFSAYNSVLYINYKPVSHMTEKHKVFIFIFIKLIHMHFCLKGGFCQF